MAKRRVERYTDSERGAILANMEKNGVSAGTIWQDHEAPSEGAPTASHRECFPRRVAASRGA